MVSWMLLRECRCDHRGKRGRVAGLIAIAAIVLFIALDIFFALNLPRQNFFTHLIALACILFIGW